MKQIIGAGLLALVLFGGVREAAAADEEEQLQAKLQGIQKQKAELQQQEQALLRQEQELLAQVTQLRAKHAGSVKAEVTGVLRFEDGRGYFVSVRYADEPDRENRVWLWISEQKVLVRKLEGLTGKQVVARGELAQLPEDVRTSVPPLGIYLRGPEVEAAESK